MKQKQIFTLILGLFLSFSISSQSILKEGSYELKIKSYHPTTLNLYYEDEVLLGNIIIDLQIDEQEREQEKDPIIAYDKIQLSFEDPVPTKFASKTSAFQKCSIVISKELTLEIILNDECLSYRWQLNSEKELEVKNEKLSFELNGDDMVFFPKEDRMISHYERLYENRAVDSIHAKEFCSLPVLFDKTSGPKILFTEADLYSYPGMFLEKGEGGQFHATFPKYVLEAIAADKGSDRNQIISKEANFICKTKGKRTFPWRVFVLAENDKELLTNTSVYQLSRANNDAGYSWVKPGQVAWDWWNANNIYGVDFKSGINNETYKYYIDFASKYGLEYIILDEGWSKSTIDILNCQEEIDIEELVKYGKEKNVGIILWTLWKPLDEKMDEAMSLYEKWGVKGIKVDFMQRADQYMVEYYERVAQMAAEYHLLVDYHGAFKPAGLRRAYPNVVNYEGLKGLENVKWSDYITPEHNLTFPFIRMVAGPVDYTPGAMDNAHKENYSIRWTRPMSMGTRCHQVAMYIIYESPLQMLADNPSNYYREHETTEFISQIPTVWDETIVLEAKIGEYILMARRNGNKWYLGGMSSEEQEFSVDLSFLGKQNHEISIMQDGINSDLNAQDISKSKGQLSSKTPYLVKMNKGGGFAAIISPLN